MACGVGVALPSAPRVRRMLDTDMSEYEPEVAEDAAAIQAIAEEIRGRIQLQLEKMLAGRKSVWFG